MSDYDEAVKKGAIYVPGYNPPGGTVAFEQKRRADAESARRSSGGGGGTSGGCFVATAAFGDFNAPEVVYLRRFRDVSLSQSVWGRGFIRSYYAFSPPLAGVIAKSETLRRWVREGFLHPTISLLEYWQASGIHLEIGNDRNVPEPGSELAPVTEEGSGFKGNRRKRRYAIATAIVLPLIIVGIVFAVIAIGTNRDYERMEGVWESTHSNNTKFAIIVEGDSVDLGRDLDSKRLRFILDSSTTPKQFTVKGFGGDKEDLRGIFELSGQKMKVAIANRKDDPLPTEFTEKNTWLFEYKGKSTNFAPVDSNYLAGLATWNYLLQVHQISVRVGSALPKFDKDAGMDQQLETIESGVTALEKMHADINELPVSGVDSELTSYVAKLINSLNQLKTLLKDLTLLGEDMKRFIARSNSQEAAAGRFWDWVFSNENGTNQELAAERQQLQGRLANLQNRITPAEAEFNRVMAQQLELRSSLSRKYNREFPQF